jgi:hypothetical protein
MQSVREDTNETRNTYISCIVHRATLGDGHENWLMIRSRVDRRDLVNALWDATSNLRRKDPALRFLVEALEEDKFLRIRRVWPPELSCCGAE